MALKQNFWKYLGFVFLSIGMIGIVVPLLPTTEFLILASFCFAKSSEKLHYWMLNNRIFGSYLKSYIQKKGISKKQKVITILAVDMLLALSYLSVESKTMKILLVTIAVAVTAHIIFLRTAKR